MDRLNNLFIAIIWFIGILFLGTLGYMIIEGWSILDSFYMTVITVATVGFSEVHNIQTVIGKLFTIGLIFLGVGFFAYAGGIIIQFTVEGQIRKYLGRRRLEKHIKQLKNHYIICGYGRIGKVLYQQLATKFSDIVVIEHDTQLIEELDEEGILYIPGTATDEKILIDAGIRNAKVLVAALGADPDNVFLVLAAKHLNPKISIVARACNKSSKKILMSAGADRVESPYDIGAVRMAQSILRPTVVSFLDHAFARNTKEIQMEELSVSESSKYNKVILQHSGIRQDFNLIIIGIKTKDGKMNFNPSSSTCLNADDTIIAIGPKDSLVAFERALNP